MNAEANAENFVNDSGNENEASEEIAPEVPAAKKEVEKQQEAQLRAKYPGMKCAGGSELLQKRILKGAKFFDSGDYNMAKSSSKPGPGIPAKQLQPPAEKLLLPTPETVPQRKSSIISSTKLYPNP